MSPNNSDQLDMFSRERYDEYFRRAAASKVHSQFCKRVYGADLCQHGLMDIEELDFLVSLITPHSKILEVGCSNGYITEYIHDRSSASILGIDFSNVAIEQARERTTHKSETLRVEHVDLTKQAIPGSGYDYIISIDSIYFLGEFKDSLLRFKQKLGDTGTIIVCVFQVKKDEDPDQILLADHTLLAQASRELELEYRCYDFTKNVRAHGLKNYQAAQKLKETFIAEGNEFLYQARAAENVFFKQAAEKEELVRFMYVFGIY